MKRKELSKKFEMNRLMTSDNQRTLTHWDLILSKKFILLISASKIYVIRHV